MGLCVCVCVYCCCGRMGRAGYGLHTNELALYQNTLALITHFRERERAREIEQERAREIEGGGGEAERKRPCVCQHGVCVQCNAIALLAQQADQSFKPVCTGRYKIVNLRFQCVMVPG